MKYKNVWPDGTALKGATPAGFGLGVGKGPKAGGARPTKEQYVRVYTPRLNKVIYGTMLSHHNAAAQIRVTDPDTIVYPFIIQNSDDAESGIKPSIDQFLILPRPAPNEEYDEFKVLTFDHGDSGAIVINHENLVIGLISRVVDVKKLFPDPTVETATVDRVGVANVIGAVLDQLNLEIPSADAGYSGTYRPAGIRADLRARRSPGSLARGAPRDGRPTARRAQDEAPWKTPPGKDRRAQCGSRTPDYTGARRQRGVEPVQGPGILCSLSSQRRRPAAHHSHNDQWHDARRAGGRAPAAAGSTWPP